MKKIHLVIVVVGSLLLGYLSVQLPKIIGSLTDAFVQNQVLARPMIALAILLFGINILNAINQYVTQTLGIEYADEMRHKVIDKYVLLDTDVLLGTGEYRQLFSADIQALQQFFAATLPKCLQQSITFLLAVYALGKIDLWLLLAILSPMVCYTLPTKYFNYRQKKILVALRKTQIESQEIANNSFENKAEIYQFNNAPFFVERFSKQQQHWAELFLKVDVAKNIFKTFPRTLDALSLALAFLIGGYLFMAHALTLGQLVSILGYLTYLNAPFKNVFILLLDVQQALLARRSLNNYLALKEIKSGGLSLPKLNQVEFIQSKQLVVTLTPGKHLYLLGKTGSGKSTLFNQLCGYDTGSDVEIKYNQNKIASFKLQDLRRQVTLVAQQGIILPGTIRENIWLTPESRLLPAEQKFFDDWVSRFEKGAETIVNEDHAGLSGGERQIIWILRALAQAKGLLLLDEITAALDGQIAKELTKLVDTRQDLIVIEILHRTQHLKPTDKVLYLENGQLAYTDFKRVGQINDTNITAK